MAPPARAQLEKAEQEEDEETNKEEMGDSSEEEEGEGMPLAEYKQQHQKSHNRVGP